MSDIDKIRERHEATLFIDWEKEFDPEWQPGSLGNAQQCHEDRGNLLFKLDAVNVILKEMETAEPMTRNHWLKKLMEAVGEQE